ncbi:hypothetical protein V5799_016346 [Amblyomma americanum]|uniref:Fatty acyl-CoA reductase n=1 Tax=Amblyomma americanum TaxID=6943 RepID=A0AAQ4F606_AMBAM
MACRLPASCLPDLPPNACRSHCCIVYLGSEQQQPSPPTDFVTDGNGDSQVARFYQDRAVFLTGGTGFIGKAFVHVSTAYTNCEKIGEVHEMIYEPCVDIETVTATAQCTEDKSMGNEDEFLFGMPNTYTLTKRLAEVLLRDEHGSTPVAIVRPSIVTASWKEPFPVREVGPGPAAVSCSRRYTSPHISEKFYTCNTPLCCVLSRADRSPPWGPLAPSNGRKAYQLHW